MSSEVHAQARFFTVTAIRVGAMSNYDGGILCRFECPGVDGWLLGLWNAEVYELRDQMEIARQHFADNGFAEKSESRAQSVSAEDYEKACASVAKWSLDIHSDGVLWTVDSSDGSKLGLHLNPRQVSTLLLELNVVIDCVLHVDARTLKGKSWTDILRILEADSGFQLAQRQRAFDFSIEVFRRNAQALQAHLKEAARTTDFSALRRDRQFSIDLLLEDAIYLLFNFVASALGLVDHSRSFYRMHYESRGKIVEYLQETKRRFAADGLVQFVHGLRQLMLHVGLVGLVHTSRLSSQGVFRSVVMMRDDALKWDNWPAVARKWLECGPAEINLGEAVSAYISKVEDFQIWYRDQRDAADWWEVARANRLQSICLVRRGMEQVGRWRELFSLSVSDFAKVRETIGRSLREEDLFPLRESESDPSVWLPHAIDMARKQFFVPTQLCDDLVSKFAPTANRPSLTAQFGGEAYAADSIIDVLPKHYIRPLGRPQTNES